MTELDEIVRLVQDRLQQRQLTTINVTTTDVATLTAKDALRAAHVVITDVEPIDLANLLALDTTKPFVDFVQQALADDDDVTFQINFTNVNFIPWVMLTDWSLHFTLADQRKLAVRRSKTLTRSDVAAIPQDTVLIKRVDQRLTASAQDLIRDQQIQMLERTDQLCIWQK